MRKLTLRYFSEKFALRHYYGTANSTLNGFLTGERICYKKYFYALRPLLCCQWIERYHAVPPVEFEKLLTLFNEPDDVLKTETEEKDLDPQMLVIIDFIWEECLRQNRFQMWRRTITGVITRS